MWEHQFGKRVSQIRRERNLTRAEFAELIGVTERYVGNIERGKHTITGAVIARLCDRMGVSADYVMFGTHDPLTEIAASNGFSHEQAQLTLDIAMRVIRFLNTPSANHALIQEVMRQHQTAAV